LRGPFSLSLSKDGGTALDNYSLVPPLPWNLLRRRFVLLMQTNKHTTMTGRILFDIEALMGLGGLLAVALYWDALKSMFRVRGNDDRANA
jgi:hypothetical protein